MVMNNLYSVHMDPEYWGDPENFRPERFINADGTFRKDERMIPFGKGNNLVKKMFLEVLLLQVSFSRL